MRGVTDRGACTKYTKGHDRDFELRLREALAHDSEGWRELYERFSPVDVETGERRSRTPPPSRDSRRAAVLLPVLPVSERPHLVYTLRKGNLTDHAGQISFPGGGVEPGDASLVDTALRETREEVGVRDAQVEVIGQMEEMYIPPSDYLVAPFVGLLSEDVELSLQPEEVEEVFTVPLQELMSDDSFQHVIWRREGRSYEVPVFAVEGLAAAEGEGYSRSYEIWGATAAITAGLLYRLGWRPGAGCGPAPSG